MSGNNSKCLYCGQILRDAPSPVVLDRKAIQRQLKKLSVGWRRSLAGSGRYFYMSVEV